MPAAKIAELHLPTAADTTACAMQLASKVGAGDCILLEGRLGSGKTHFARALIQEKMAEADQREHVPSPTYTLVQTYQVGELEIWHADLFRLSSPDELVELGLDEAFGNSLVIVEWPDRMGDMAPTNALCIRFEFQDHGRKLFVSGPVHLLNVFQHSDG